MLMLKFWKKKRVAILANCQGGIYKQLFLKSSEFNKKYEFIELPLVHTLTNQNKEKIYETLKNIDFLFYQPLSSLKYEAYFIDNLKKVLPYSCKTISIPILYFNFYAPHTIYILPGQLPKFIIEYHDINIVLGWYYKIDKNNLYKSLTDARFYSSNLLENIAQANFKQLKQREQTIDLKFSDHLKSIYRQHTSFNTFNHPKNEILLYMASKIFDQLKIPAQFQSYSEDFLGNVRVAIYPSIQSYCFQRDDREREYKIFGKHMSLSNMIDEYYNYYDEQEAEINKFVKNKLLKTADDSERLIIDNFITKFDI